MSLTITVATQADEAAVAGILQSAYPILLRPAYGEEILARALPFVVRANPTLLASGRYYITRTSDGRPVGCGGWSPEKPGSQNVEPGIGHLRHFGILADQAGQGIGRRIYQHCETQARAAGIQTFEVYATLNAEPFYAALGFRKIDDIVVMLGGETAFPSIWMRRPNFGQNTISI